MEGNQSSGVSNAGATRKRRSSILKSQRPPRIPLSEVEFNVATPTDTSKSRRVSFSRKTGVAEFATNEATTTWKNFYEEQNHSLESSGHDAERPPRPSTLGNRLFDQQFQEVEAEIDFGTFAPNPMGLSTSLNNVNITQQIAMLDCVDDKITAPSNKYDVSAFTETNSKIINDMTNPTMCGDTGRIDINFSNLNSLGNKDDLDEIERDLEISRPNIVGPGPFAGEVSQYIEFDLNGTQGRLRGNESDMSITDTIHSPKKEVSKSLSITERNWLDDKENIVVNPYVTPAEADNFAVNDETSQVLVFDGKKLKYADINADLDEVVEDVRKSNRQTVVESLGGVVSVTNLIQKGNNSIVFHEDDNNMPDMSVTKIDVPIQKRQTVLFGDDGNGLSVTQDISNAEISNIYEQNLKESNNKENEPRRQTVVFANDDLDADISMTQAIPTNILARKSIKPEEPENNKLLLKRQTIVFANDDLDADISMTQAIPTNILARKSIQPEKPENNKPLRKRQTIVFANDDLDADISMTQAIPTNIMCKTSLKPDIFDNITTQTKRQTVVFDNEDTDAEISMTQAIPTNILNRKSIKPEIAETSDNEPKTQTIVFANDDLDADISMTQSIPSNIMNRMSIKPEDKILQTVVFEKDDENAEISITQAIPSNIMKRKSVAPENTDVGLKDEPDISITQAVPIKILCNEPKITEHEVKRQTLVFHKDDLDADISMTQIIPSNIVDINSLYPAISENTTTESKRKTVVFDNDDIDADISITQAIPSNIICRKSLKPEIIETVNVKRNTQVFDDNSIHKSVSDNLMKPSLTSIYHDSISDNMAEENKNDVNTVCIMDAVQPNIDIDSSSQGDFDKSNKKQTVHDDSLSDKSFLENETFEFSDDSSEISNQIQNKKSYNYNTSQYKPETLVYTLTTTVDSTENNLAVPSSKGDEFHASSSNIQQEDVNSALDNPHTTSHSHKAPKVLTKKTAEQVESKFEAAINSISYDSVASSTKIVEKKSESQASECSTKSDIVSRKSVLNELLDMSYASLPDGFEDKDVMVKPVVTESEPDIVEVSVNDLGLKDGISPVESKDQISPMEFKNEISPVESNDVVMTPKDSQEGKECIKDKTSNNSMFLIMRDSEDDIQFPIREVNRTTDTKDLGTHIVKEENNLEKNLEELLQRTASRKSLRADMLEANKSQMDIDAPSNITRDLNKSKINLDISRKTFKDADDTKELLEILSHLTDKTISHDKSPRKSVAQSKSEQAKRLTFSMDVESLKSKDLLSEALSKNCELEEEEEEYVPETPAQPSRKSIRLSHDVVKTLHYDDEPEIKTSALKKTAFGETSYMTDKAKVIPSFVNVSDGIKELMDDLVKPMADVIIPLPKKVDKCINNNPSTCSTQIQANLISSSQIDFELCSTSSNTEMSNLASDVAYVGNRSVSKALQEAVYSEPISENPSFYGEVEKRVTESQKVIVFDQNNPLNNVLLAPKDFANAHKYNPDEYKQEYEVERVSVKFEHERVDPLPNIQEEICSVKSESATVTEVVDSEVNTIIAMKTNEDLLQGSSLTLIEDDMDVDEPKLKPHSPIKVIYHLDEIVLDDDISRKRNYSPTKIENSSSKLEVTPKPLSKVQRLSNSPISVGLARKSTDGYTTSPDRKGRKSPEKSPTRKIDNRSSPVRKLENKQSPIKRTDVKMISPVKGSDKLDGKLSPTRKPENKLSPTGKSDKQDNNSPRRKSVANRASLTTSSKSLSPSNRSPDCLPKSADVYNKPNTILTVQRMEAEYGSDDRMDDATSFASSKRQTVKDSTSVISGDSRSPPATISSKASCKRENNDTRKQQVGDSDSANVVTKIDMLPCMGTKLCEWDPEAPGVDTMSFRLLHARVRVALRLRHAHGNAARTHVRAGTKVEAADARACIHDHNPTEIKKVIATLSVSFAAEAMRFILKDVEKAGDIPNALKRCATVADSALRWAKCMYEAYIQLAFSLTADGNLKLKVCNLPLRSVWDVTMRVKLSQSSTLPYPEASEVSASSVVGETPILPEITGTGWGHVPTTIWKVFRHLKYKKAVEASLMNT